MRKTKTKTSLQRSQVQIDTYVDSSQFLNMKFKQKDVVRFCMDIDEYSILYTYTKTREDGNANAQFPDHLNMKKNIHNFKRNAIGLCIQNNEIIKKAPPL